MRLSSPSWAGAEVVLLSTSADSVTVKSLRRLQATRGRVDGDVAERAVLLAGRARG